MLTARSMVEDQRHTPYPEALAGRFAAYLALVRTAHPNLGASRLAQELGYADSRFLDGLGTGREYPDWHAIDDFCERSGVDARWFKHGEGQPFGPSGACEPEVMALLDELDAPSPRQPYLVRSDCAEGRVCFVVRAGEFTWHVYSTLLHLSARNGGGGARNLLELYHLLRALEAERSLSPASYTLPLAQFEALADGRAFPATVFRRVVQCHWADDFTELADSGSAIRWRRETHGREFVDAQAIVRAELARTGATWHGEGGGRGERVGHDADACPVCGYRRRSLTIAQAADDGMLEIHCPRCGPFRIVAKRASVDDAARSRVSAWIRDHDESAREVPTVPNDGLTTFVASLPNPSLAARQDLLLAALGRRTRASETAEIAYAEDYPLASAESPAELRHLLRTLAEKGLVRATESDSAATCEITPAGWERLDASASSIPNGGQVFVAMSFDRALEAAWRAGIRRAIEAAGYRAYRVDKDEHVERIDAKVHAEIDRSDFLVADVTGHRQGVYFEAGYAMGKGKRVVWSVRADDLDRVHFDTRQFNHVVWRNPAELRRRLTARIKGAIKAD